MPIYRRGRPSASGLDPEAVHRSTSPGDRSETLGQPLAIGDCPYDAP